MLRNLECCSPREQARDISSEVSEIQAVELSRVGTLLHIRWDVACHKYLLQVRIIPEDSHTSWCSGSISSESEVVVTWAHRSPDSVDEVKRIVAIRPCCTSQHYGPCLRVDLQHIPGE